MPAVWGLIIGAILGAMVWRNGARRSIAIARAAGREALAALGNPVGAGILGWMAYRLARQTGIAPAAATKPGNGTSAPPAE